MATPRILSCNKDFEKQILKWQQFDIVPVTNAVKVAGFDEYNYLIDLNLLLDPSWLTCSLIDRSEFILSPYNFKIKRPWRLPPGTISLEKFFENRVHDYCQHNVIINLFWSGGIDSTAVIVAFLNHCSNLDQIRIVYTSASCQEHPKFFKLLTEQFPQIEKVRLDLYNFMSITLDGLAVTGDPADQLVGCLTPDSAYCSDTSILFQPWKDFVNKQGGTNLVEFVEQWVSAAKKPITTVMDIRWWNYMQTHVQGDMVRVNVALKNLCHEHQWDAGFYDCYEFEDYVYHHTHQLGNFDSFKNFLKSYIYEFDNDLEFREQSTKVVSTQLSNILSKLEMIKDLNWIFALDNCTVASTDNLPLLSSIELDRAFGNQFDDSFNRRT